MRTQSRRILGDLSGKPHVWPFRFHSAALHPHSVQYFGPRTFPSAVSLCFSFLIGLSVSTLMMVWKTGKL